MKVSDFAGYRAAAAKLNDLQKQLSQAEKDAGNLEGSEDKAVPITDRDALAILSGNELPATSEDSPRAQAWRKVHALRRAVELQREELYRERFKASEKICVDERPKYAAILRKMASAVEALTKAHCEEREFREALMADDVKFTSYIRPCGFLTQLDLAQETEFWLRDVKDSGFTV